MKGSEPMIVLDSEREQVAELSIQFIEKILQLDSKSTLEAASSPPGTMAGSTL